MDRRHPWVMSGSVEREGGAPGERVEVRAHDGRRLGVGHYSPASQLRVRMLTFGAASLDPAALDAELAGRVHRAVARRAQDPLLAGLTALRLVNSEGDDLPGLTVDRFGAVLVVKPTTRGMLAELPLVAGALRDATAALGVESALLRGDPAALQREGLEEAPEGSLFGPEPPERVWIEERGRRYAVDVRRGQKTGFYLDQRESRDLCQGLAPGRRALDLYAHTGGFAVAAALGGAREVTVVESSKDALALAAENLAATAPAVPARLVAADVHRFLREDTGEYDLLVVDPPPLARSKKDVDRAARAHKDSLLHALRRAADDALVLAFSCSHHVGPELFRQITFGASLDAGRPLQVLRELGHPLDHPVGLDHPEGRYLAGLLLRAGRR